MQSVAEISAFVIQPALHSKQSPITAFGAYRPTRQSTHSLLFLRYCPLSHCFSWQNIRVSWDISPGGQLTHSAFPSSPWNSPTGHS